MAKSKKLYQKNIAEETTLNRNGIEFFFTCKGITELRLQTSALPAQKSHQQDLHKRNPQFFFVCDREQINSYQPFHQFFLHWGEPGDFKLIVAPSFDRYFSGWFYELGNVKFQSNIVWCGQKDEVGKELTAGPVIEVVVVCEGLRKKFQSLPRRKSYLVFNGISGYWVCVNTVTSCNAEIRF